MSKKEGQYTEALSGKIRIGEGYADASVVIPINDQTHVSLVFDDGNRGELKDPGATYLPRSYLTLWQKNSAGKWENITGLAIDALGYDREMFAREIHAPTGEDLKKFIAFAETL